jgi:glycine hydroxymethyltransferase
MDRVGPLFDILGTHERKLGASFSFIPSENLPSPLSRLAFLSDGFSRYFFDEKEVFGRWNFQGGSIVGRVQQEILVPLLREVGGARHVNLHPVSGLTGMTLALAAFGGDRGSTVLSVPTACGGHPDTAYVGTKLGYAMRDIPFAGWADADLDALAERVRLERPTLLYVDHATALFPLDLRAFVDAVRLGAGGRPVHVHVDTSHVNGLVWGGQLPNPLACGADSYGGSTHKTFPGPHKAVLLTDDDAAAERLVLTGVNMISHHHTASMVALAIALVEWVECGGREYAAQVLRNARAFAARLAELGDDVQGRERGFTASHQVWVAPRPGADAYAAADRLFQAGLVVNPYAPLPSLGAVGLRLGLNEPTRLGVDESGARTLAELVHRVLDGEAPEAVARDVAGMRRDLAPAYCYGDEVVRREREALAAAAPAAGAWAGEPWG